jgi:hypothetical protein
MPITKSHPVTLLNITNEAKVVNVFVQTLSSFCPTSPSKKKKKCHVLSTWIAQHNGEALFLRLPIFDYKNFTEQKAAVLAARCFPLRPNFFF